MLKLYLPGEVFLFEEIPHYLFQCNCKNVKIVKSILLFFFLRMLLWFFPKSYLKLLYFYETLASLWSLKMKINRLGWFCVGWTPSSIFHFNVIAEILSPFSKLWFSNYLRCYCLKWVWIYSGKKYFLCQSQLRLFF